MYIDLCYILISIIDKNYRNFALSLNINNNKTLPNYGT